MNNGPANLAIRSVSPAAFWILALAVPYTVLNTAFPGAFFVYAGGLIIAVAAVAIAARWGLDRRLMLLRLRAPSPLTIGAVAVMAAVALPIVALADRLGSAPGPAMFVGAGASAIGQEVYFRGALLASLRYQAHLTPNCAAAVEGIVFAAWHLRALRESDPLTAAGVLVAAFAVGTAWGWLAMHDGTIVPVAAAHAAFLVIQ